MGARGSDRLGFCGGAQIVGFELTRVGDVLLVWPLLLGLLTYLMDASFGVAMIHTAAISQIYKHRLPTAHYSRLVHLCTSVTFFGIERVLAHEAGWRRHTRLFDSVWKAILIIIVTVLPLLAFIHVCYLAWVNSDWPWYAMLASIILGAAATARGWVLLYVGDQYTSESQD